VTAFAKFTENSLASDCTMSIGMHGTTQPHGTTPVFELKNQPILFRHSSRVPWLTLSGTQETKKKILKIKRKILNPYVSLYMKS
jgi:hypothetical protein